MNKVLAGEAGKEKAREWGRWLATDEGQAYLAAQMDADFFEERENMDDGICEESRKRVFYNLQKNFEKTFCRTNSKSGSGDGTRCSCYSHITLS